MSIDCLHVTPSPASVHLYRSVDSTNKHEARQEADCPSANSERIRGQEHVTHIHESRSKAHDVQLGVVIMYMLEGQTGQKMIGIILCMCVVLLEYWSM